MMKYCNTLNPSDDYHYSEVIRGNSGTIVSARLAISGDDKKSTAEVDFDTYRFDASTLTKNANGVAASDDGEGVPLITAKDVDKKLYVEVESDATCKKLGGLVSDFRSGYFVTGSDVYHLEVDDYFAPVVMKHLGNHVFENASYTTVSNSKDYKIFYLGLDFLAFRKIPEQNSMIGHKSLLVRTFNLPYYSTNSIGQHLISLPLEMSEIEFEVAKKDGAMIQRCTLKSKNDGTFEHNCNTPELKFLNFGLTLYSLKYQININQGGRPIVIVFINSEKNNNFLVGFKDSAKFLDRDFTFKKGDISIKAVATKFKSNASDSKDFVGLGGNNNSNLIIIFCCISAAVVFSGVVIFFFIYRRRTHF